LIAGGFGIAVQFMPDGEILAFMVSTAALGGLIGGSNDYNEQDRQQLRQSYKTAYEWLLLAIMAAYAFIVISRWLHIIEGGVSFLNGHWPGLVISMMCLFMGMAGFQRIRKESST
jgi:FtsH-binding integral membrane protein